MIENIKNSQIPSTLRELSARQSEPSKGSASSQADASLQVSCELLIEKAKQVPSEDVGKVQLARELLLSGNLDNPENIRAAAEAIVKFGI